MMMRPTVTAIGLVVLLVGTVGAQRDQTYLVPQHPECDPDLPAGSDLRLGLLNPALLQKGEVVVPPWEPLGTIAVAPYESVPALIDFARCVYTFGRAMPDLTGELNPGASLERALALVRERRGRASAPSGKPVQPRAPFRAGRDVPVPAKTGDEAPRFTPEALRRQAAGIVFLDAVIDTSGKVGVTRILGSIPSLDDEAERAVRRWTFAPTTVDGRRVQVVKLVTVKFSPDPAPSAADGMDIARFHIARGELAEGEGALVATLEAIRREGAAAAPAKADPHLADIRRAREPKRGDGVTLPVVVRTVQPKYTREAMQEKITGTVQMRVVVLSDGRIGAIRVIKSLDRAYGLDAEAVQAARQWTFRPAQDASGTAIPAVATLEMEFRLR